MGVGMLKLPTRCKWCPSSFSSSMILKSVTPGSLWPALFSPTSCKDTLTQGMFSGNIQVCSFFSVCKWPVLLSFSHLIFDRNPKSLSAPKSLVINDFHSFEIEFSPSLYLCVRILTGWVTTFTVMAQIVPMLWLGLHNLYLIFVLTEACPWSITAWP